MTLLRYSAWQSAGQKRTSTLGAGDKDRFWGVSPLPTKSPGTLHIQGSKGRQWIYVGRVYRRNLCPDRRKCFGRTHRPAGGRGGTQPERLLKQSGWPAYNTDQSRRRQLCSGASLPTECENSGTLHIRRSRVDITARYIGKPLLSPAKR